MQNEPIEVTLKVTDVLEKLSIPYVIGGSLASTLYGMVRTTQDSDIITEMHLEHVQPFIHALGEEFFVDEEMIVDSIKHIMQRTTLAVSVHPDLSVIVKARRELPPPSRPAMQAGHLPQIRLA